LLEKAGIPVPAVQAKRSRGHIARAAAAAQQAAA
jgi:hypothetical protein